MNLIKWLDNWYASQCDGNWEHDYGVNIETLDNPGWSIKINLNYTNTPLDDRKWRLIELSENQWIGYKIKDGFFDAASVPKNLEILIYIFKKLVENDNIKDEEVINFLK